MASPPPDDKTRSSRPTRPPRVYQPLVPPEQPTFQVQERHAAPPPPTRLFGLDKTFATRQIAPTVGYVILGGATVAVLVVLFTITRLASFLGGISVERQDANGKVIEVSSITGQGRVNIALLGLDRRPNDQEGTRSDTMLLLSVDQDNKTANLLSVPRDLWVKIPGHDFNRINTAYFFGDQEQPGKGGAVLVKQTIEQNFGIKIDYFAEIDFNGFRSIIDAIGGVTIDVKKPLVDNEYPTEDYGIKRIHIPAGLQHMNGQIALEYARSRHSDSDLGRNQRQQEVLIAVREQGINLSILTNTSLQNALQSTVRTDLTPTDILALGRIAVGMKREAIKQFSVDANVAHNTVINGNEVLQVDQEALRTLLANFQASTAAPVQLETAKLSILNGTFIEGRAARTQKFLEDKGYTIVKIDQAPNAGTYPQTIINVYGNKSKAASQLATLLNVNPVNIRQLGAISGNIEIEIICGEDLKLP